MHWPVPIPAALRARAHAAVGWCAYRLGLATTARRRFEHVLLLRGADFGAYVHLGRIAFNAGDYAGWRREFEHARRLDPVRFARLNHPLELFEPRLAGTRLDRRVPAPETAEFPATDARATWSAEGDPSDDVAPEANATEGLDHGLPLMPNYDPLTPEGEDYVDPNGSADPFADFDEIPSPRTGDRAPSHDAAVTRDDFSSAAERRRFELRRPIDQKDIARCDLTELARRLSS